MLMSSTVAAVPCGLAVDSQVFDHTSVIRFLEEPGEEGLPRLLAGPHRFRADGLAAHSLLQRLQELGQRAVLRHGRGDEARAAERDQCRDLGGAQLVTAKVEGHAAYGARLGGAAHIGARSVPVRHAAPADGDAVEIETTRPELLPACVALVAVKAASVGAGAPRGRPTTSKSARSTFASGTGETYVVPCDLVVTCIGYKTSPIPGVPFEESAGRFANDEGRILPGLYCVGWARRGPSGTIGTNRRSRRRDKLGLGF